MENYLKARGMDTSIYIYNFIIYIHNYRKYMYRLIKQLAYEKNVRCRITYATVVGGFSSFTWAILCLACRPRGIFPNLYIYCRYVLLFKQRTRHTHPWQIAIANLDASKTVELRSSNCHVTSSQGAQQKQLGRPVFGNPDVHIMIVFALLQAWMDSAW